MKLLLAVLLVVSASAYGKTLVVNNNAANTSSPCKTAAYTTIGSAITAASAGDTVEVCPGTYPEAISITKANLKLTGLTSNNSSLVELLPTAGITIADANSNAENADQSVVLLVDSVTGVAISGISVNGSKATTTCGSGNSGIYFRNASGSITNSSVSYVGLNSDGTLTGCQEGSAIYVDSGSGDAASLTVTDSNIHDYDKNGISAWWSGTTLVATGNTITGAGPTTATAQNGVELVYGAKGTVNSNTIVSNDYTPTSSSASGILFYEAAANGEANDNTISDTNNGVYFYLSNNGTANGNNISKIFNFNALDAVNSNNVEFEKNIISRAGLETDTAGIYICASSKVKTESNSITDAPIGVEDDRTSADSSTGSSGNTTTLNLYREVGIDSETVTDATPKAMIAGVNRASQSAEHRGLPKP